MNSISEPTNASRAYALQHDSATSLPKTATPVGPRLPEQGQTAGLRHGAQQGKRRFLDATRSTSVPPSVSTDPAPPPGTQPHPSVLLHQRIDGIVRDILALIGTHWQQEDPYERSNDRQPARSAFPVTPQASPDKLSPQAIAALCEILLVLKQLQKVIAPAHSTNPSAPESLPPDAAPPAAAQSRTTPATVPALHIAAPLQVKALTPSPSPPLRHRQIGTLVGQQRGTDARHRTAQSANRLGARLKNNLALMFNRQDLPVDASPCPPQPGVALHSRTAAAAHGFAPDELRQAMAASIASENLRRATVDSIESEHMRLAMANSMAAENLPQAVLDGPAAESFRQEDPASTGSEQCRIAERDRPAALATAALAKGYFDKYPNGVGGSDGRRRSMTEDATAESASDSASDGGAAPQDVATASQDVRAAPENVAAAPDHVLDAPKELADAHKDVAAAALDVVYSRMASCNAAFSPWLESNNLRVVPTSGDGNNCLIVSLICHATGDYEADHQVQAAVLRKELVAKFKIEETQMLLPGSPEVSYLLDQLGQSHPPIMHIAEIQPGPDGIPQMLRADGTPFFYMAELEGRRIAPIFQYGAHFEPIIARS